MGGGTSDAYTYTGPRLFGDHCLGPGAASGDFYTIDFVYRQTNNNGCYLNFFVT
jgi:hypothetical protein